MLHVLPWFQSPIDTLSALYTPWRFLHEITLNPNEVIKDLEFVTNFTIEFIRLLQKTFPDKTSYCFENEVWMPHGVSLFEDGIDVFSRLLPKDYYEKFALPFNQNIADEFGGLGLHTCGEVTHHVLEALSRFENLIAFQYDAAQTSTARVLDLLGGKKIALVPRYSFAGIDKQLRSHTKIEHPMDYVKAIVDNWHHQSWHASMFLVVPMTINSLLSQNEPKSQHDDVRVVIHNTTDLETVFKTLDNLGLAVLPKNKRIVNDIPG